MLRALYEAQTDGRDLQPAELDELEIEGMLRPSARVQGQGIGLSADERRAVELRAMNLAENWLVQEGYEVTNTAARYPYDFLACRGEDTLKVEVKGTTSDNPRAILMTRNEVRLHQTENGSTALIIISSIRLVGPRNRRRAEGGNLEAFVGWDIDEWNLQETAYRVIRP